MVNGKYHKGITTELHNNGRGPMGGRSILFHVNESASIDEVMATGFFDLANRGRGRFPWIKPGDLIDVDAFDGHARLRIMSMDENNAGIVTMAMYGPVLFDQEPAVDEKPKRRPGRPTNAELAARDAAELN